MPKLLPSDAKPSPVVKRLWICGGGWALFLITCLIANLFVAPDKRVTTRSAGHDFLAFYTAGTFVQEGRTKDLYSINAVKDFEQQIARQEKLELGKGYGPYWNAPVFAWVFVPLVGFGYTPAWWIWFGINVVCGVMAVGVLIEILKNSHTGKMPVLRWGLVPLLVCGSLPFIMALGHGQNTCISLLILSGVVWFWRKGDAIKAGILCGLLSYKPQLAAVIAGMLVLTMGWRAIVGLGTSGTILLLASAVSMPGAMHDWSQRLPELIKYMQVDHRYMWERHVTLKSFWRLLLMGYSTGNSSPAVVGLWVLSVAGLTFGMTLALVRTLLEKQNRDRLIAATIVSMPLLMPFYFDYDLLLLAIPAVLFAIEKAQGSGFRVQDKITMGLWVALFAWMFANPFVAGQTHINGTVLLLAALSAMLIRKACQTQAITQTERPVIERVAMAA